MSGGRLLDIRMLHLLWVLPVLLAVVVYGYGQRRAALRRFVGLGMLGRLPAPVSWVARAWKTVLVLAAIACLVVALARPVWNEKEITVKRAGRDVVFLLDVSKSMLAEDLAPNRLERAKLAILDVVEQLQGDRVALVAFAGSAAVKCPLTLDYGFFRTMLEEISVNTISRGGTMIGDAVRTVVDQVFDRQQRQYKDIILITDGEDHESFPREAAKAAGEQGVRMLIVGLGDEGEGQRIPITDANGRKIFLRYQGQEVWTRLDADTLRQMAASTPGGRYLPVATGTIDLGAVYRDLVVSAAKRELDSQTLRRYEEKFQIFLAFVLLLLAGEAMISERRRAGSGAGSGNEGAVKAVGFFVFVVLLAATEVWAESARGLVAEGNRLYEAGQFSEAISRYDQARDKSPEAPRIFFNRGDALYRQGKYEEAGTAFDQAANLAADDPALAAQSRYNQGNALFQLGEGQHDKAPEKAITQYKKSVEQFQEARRLDPQLTEAGRNIEVARRQIRFLEEQLRKQPQTGKDKDKDKEQNKGENNDNQEPQPGQDAPAEQKDQPPSAGQDQPEEKAKDKETAKGKESKSGQEPKGGRPQSEDQEQARTPSTGEDGQEVEAVSPPDRTAQDILEAEKEAREHRRQRIMRHVEVDKDW